MACSTGDPAPQTEALTVTFTEIFRVDSFSDVADMRFAPNNQLVVLDGTENELVVLNETGSELARWRTTPDAAARAPTAFDISPDGVVATDDPSGGINTFTLQGEQITSFGGGESIFDLTFDGIGNVLTLTRGLSLRALTEGSPRKVTRWPDGEVLWTSPLVASGFGRPHPFRAFPVFAYAGPGRVAVGMTDVYALSVLDTSAGTPVGRITRDVPLRGPDAAYIERFNQLLRDTGASEDRISQTVYPETFPAISYVFTGPPNGTVWLRRHLGVDDAHAAPVEIMAQSSFRLYDLFAPDSYRYLGTVEAPNLISFMDGNDELVAGEVRGPFDEETVVVFRVDVHR